MGVKETAKQVATAGAGVALAAAGCQCGTNGAVDPPPPPLVCSDVDQGQSLTASATLEGTTLRVRVDQQKGTWQSPAVVDLHGVSLVSVATTSLGQLAITLTLASTGTHSGSFTVRGTLVDESHGVACDVHRTFTFTVGAQVVIAALDARSMPLASRHAAAIVMVSRQGLEVELEARSSFGGPLRCTWFVSGGELLEQIGHRARWRLPEERGLYQAQLVLDYGSPGMAFDALSLEVV
jgi:hypothetical protein